MPQVKKKFDKVINIPVQDQPRLRVEQPLRQQAFRRRLPQQPGRPPQRRERLQLPAHTTRQQKFGNQGRCGATGLNQLNKFTFFHAQTRTLHIRLLANKDMPIERQQQQQQQRATPTSSNTTISLG